MEWSDAEMKPENSIQMQETATGIGGASSCLEASSMLLKERNLTAIGCAFEC
jgi:hypothetical protein